MKILIAEDEPKVAAFIKDGLEQLGNEVHVAYDGNTAQQLINSQSFDIALLDVIMPFTNGIELCRKIKSTKPQLPVLLLTALGTTEDKLIGFNAGADDYLVKPFEFKELVARIDALTRRNMNYSKFSNTLRVANLELDLEEKLARRNGNVISLTAKEFGLLEFLMRNAGRVLSRSQIAEKVWDITHDTGTNVVDVYINLLRKKIDKDFDTKLIHTRVGMGYILKDG